MSASAVEDGHGPTLEAVPTACSELKEIGILAAGIALSLLMEVSMGVITSAFAGHYLGPTEFAVVGLATSLINVFG